MNKFDLKPGMIVETRNSELYMVQNFHGELILVNNSGWNSLSNYNEDLTSRNYKAYDIIKIMKPDSEHYFCENFWGEAPVIWKRKEFDLTEEEKALISLLDKKWKWVARDKGGSVVVFDAKPIKNEDYGHWWKQGNGNYFYLKGFDESAKFNFLSWEDDEPTSLDELRELVKEGE